MRDSMKNHTPAPSRWLAALGLPLGVLVVAMLTLSLAGCSSSLSVTQLSTGKGIAPPSNVVELGISNFIQHKVTIKAGQSVKFIDPPSSGGVHFICVGENLKCQPTPDTPAPLAKPSGLYFTNGQAPVNIQFKQAGTYKVICTIHPGMEVVIVVK
jgi:plastocyanin